MTQPELARSIRLVGLDVDGVLTDGGIVLGADRRGAPFECTRFDVRDGLGIQLLRRAGIKVALCTGRAAESVRLRAAELQVDDLEQDRHARKLAAFERILARHGVAWEEAAFVGDDLPDVGILRRVAWPVAVANAVPEVRACCRLLLTRPGGAGAVREFAEHLLKARGDWDAVVARYAADHSAPMGEAVS